MRGDMWQVGSRGQVGDELREEVVRPIGEAKKSIAPSLAMMSARTDSSPGLRTSREWSVTAIVAAAARSSRQSSSKSL
jgi:hypothetical protein